MKVSELVEQMKEAGFGARKIGEASEILREMINDKECKKFLGVAGAMVPAGMRNIIIEMLENNYVDVSYYSPVHRQSPYKIHFLAVNFSACKGFPVDISHMLSGVRQRQNQGQNSY